MSPTTSESWERLRRVELVTEDLKPEDWSAVRAIYEEGIATRNATFETQVPTWEDWDASHLRDCRLVARKGGYVVGWGALSPVSGRSVYAGVAEVSVYVAAAAQGQGVGKRLLRALIGVSERQGIWTLQAGIFPENRASIALHESCGFRKVGIRARIGQLEDVWRDVVLLERRSDTVGV
jgi:L-amino acid N-acyltransferase YncA